MKLGASFSDAIHTEKISHLRLKDDPAHFSMRALLFPVLLVGVALILFGRLFFLQVLAGKYYSDLATTNRLRTVIVHAPRGVIFDRNGVPLTYNVPGYQETINGKTQLLTQQEALPKIAAGDKNLEINSLREYPLASSSAHVIGYIGQISPEQLQLPQFLSYGASDFIGQMGLEAQYESVLRGIDGKKLIEVDAAGNTVKTLGQTDPIPGQNITTTVDAALQKDVALAMSSVQKGAAIVSTPNGQILAMVSEPSFDPNLFTMGQGYKAPFGSAYTNVSQILLDGNGQPLLNRAISGTYPPGSTFKIVVAAAGLQSGKIDQNYMVDDTGIIRVGNFSFTNWYYSQDGKTEGNINVVTALKRSNDIFFYKVGSLLGVDTLSKYARQFGLGTTLGIDLPGEATGLVPTKEWKLQTIGEPWYLGDDYHYGIGQGYVLTTPLQVNTWTQAVANGGTLYQPHLLKTAEPKILDKNLLTEKNRDLIREGMIAVCDPGGVAYPLFDFTVANPTLKIDGKNIVGVDGHPNERHVVIACKTGTAQQGDTNALAHAWITLFAPAYNPQIVVTVLSEASGEGSDVAAPIAKEILTDWFDRQN